MSHHLKILDYDKIEEWSPWIEEIVSTVAPDGLIDEIKRSSPEFIEDARDQLVSAIGVEPLISHLTGALEPFHVRVFHGTRVTPGELKSIQAGGLRALQLQDRRAPLVDAFNKHPDWHKIEPGLDHQLHRFGADRLRTGAGKREDDSVHVCLSRAGLLRGCDHYLTYGAEVDQHLATALFSDGEGLELLARARSAKIISFTAPYADAALAANPWGVPRGEIPALMKIFVSNWAYHLAHPRFTVVSQRDSAALRFPAPIDAKRIEHIEHVNDSEIGQPL